MPGLLEPVRSDALREGESAFTYDVSSDESLSEAVVEAVSTVSGHEPVPTTPTERALDPLYTVVDPDALDSVFRPVGSAPDRLRGEVTFTYHGYEVTAHGEGYVRVERPEPAVRSSD